METKPQTMPQEKPYISIYSTIEEIENDTPEFIEFDTLTKAVSFANFINSSYAFPLVRVYNKRNEIYEEFEN